MSSNEGDSVLLGSFRSIGCNLPEDVNSVKELTAEHLVMILSKAVYLISDGDILTPSKLPSNVAARHRICTDLAEKIKLIGLPVKCGYNQILYPVEASTRSILHWVVNKLPTGSAEDDIGTESMSSEALLKRRIGKALVDWTEQPWLLPHAAYGTPVRGIYKTHPFRTAPNAVLASCDSKDGGKNISDLFAWTSRTKTPMSHSVLELHACRLAVESRAEEVLGAAFGNNAAKQRKAEQTRQLEAFKAASSSYNADAARDGRHLEFEELIGSVVAGQSGKGSRKTRFEHAAEFAEESSKGVISDELGTAGDSAAPGEQETPEERKKRKEREAADARLKEVEALKRRVGENAAKIMTLKNARAAAERAARDLGSVATQESSRQSDLERDVRLKKEALAMLPKAAENIEKMSGICRASEKKLNELNSQWNAFNSGMQDKLGSARSATEVRKQKSAAMIDQYKTLRARTQELIADKKNKQRMAQQLVKELEKLPNIDRGQYTSRIMGIVGQIEKQDEQISALASDIRETRKAINSASSGVSRADAIAEEKIYSTASGARLHTSQSNAAIEAYRSLKSLRSTFERLVETVTSIGQQDKLTVDLQTKIEQEEARISGNNYARVKEDLKKIKSENKVMFTKLQELKSQMS